MTAGRGPVMHERASPTCLFLNFFSCTPRFGVKGQQHDEPTRGVGGPSFQFESICIPFTSQDQERRGRGGCIEN